MTKDDALFKAISAGSAPAAESASWTAAAIPYCLMLGAFGKSAQIPLFVWLPDAMEGPTPVSALIHAATMVTAGVYLIARLYPMFVLYPDALTVVAWVGCLTALVAATIGLRATEEGEAQGLDIADHGEEGYYNN